MARRKSARPTFANLAREIMSLPIAHRVNRLGGYGPDGQVIYEGHPAGAPSVLVDSQGPATATFMSNGSVSLLIKLPEGMEVPVLDASFDPVEKREAGVPSQNVWLGVGAGKRRRVASLINPNVNLGCPADAIRIVKLGDPDRSMWFGATFKLAPGLVVESAVRFALVTTPAGPALLRQVCLRNVGRKKLSGDLWTYFNMHGTQRFVYNKQLWYDAGLPLTPRETVVSARVPYSDIVQIKRVSSAPANLRPIDATCDYATFVGNTAVNALLPQAVRDGAMLSGPGTAGRKLSRFATAQIAAAQFAIDLAPGKTATLEQSLLYVMDAKVIDRFRRDSGCPTPRYREIAAAFKQAATTLVKSTPDAKKAAAQSGGQTGADRPAPDFEVAMPNESVAAMYANSAWSTVEELYENCRAHGAKMAEGIELGTRDRGQDMWPKMKEDPGRVRADLVHALGFMYVTCDRTPKVGKRPLTLVEKLHGMWPRQFPSRWDHRDQEVLNDNRPYTDSPLWLVDSLNMYIRETGDVSILTEPVTTIRLTKPDDPIHSGIVGHDRMQRVIDAVLEVFACFKRHADDTPYGMAQILYGDWCDPIDMFGTNPVGDATSRGRGRGVQVRLSAHLFDCLVNTIDTLAAPSVAAAVADVRPADRARELGRFADSLRQNIVRWAWEDAKDANARPRGGKKFHAGFLDCIHEFRTDGSRPDYARGQTGYTLGSMAGRDFDGLDRRILGPQAYGLNMLRTQRNYLTPVDGADAMAAAVMRTMDELFYHPKLGLLLFTTPVANDQRGVDFVGRIGMFPVGCGENGEYHHGQVFMHRFRLDVPGQADTVWKQFKPIMSALRDESVAGPFETPCTSYASDRTDPHFGKGMYFGLSGSIDWIMETFARMAGVRLALHDDRLPDVRIDPHLPAALAGRMTFRRIVHVATGPGRYRKVPLTVSLDRKGSGRVRERLITVNGRKAGAAEVRSIGRAEAVEIEIVEVCG